MSDDNASEKVLASVGEPRRAFIKKLILGTAFAVPSIASFSIAGLSVGEAAVLCSNQQDLSGQNLRGQDLSNCQIFPGGGGNFNTVDFSGANLAGANLSHSEFLQANFSGANLNGANLTGAYLGVADTDLHGANFSGANLSGANLTNAVLEVTNLTGANLNGANLTGADLGGANLTGANLHGVVWSNTTCPDGTNSDNDGGTCIGHLATS